MNNLKHPLESKLAINKIKKKMTFNKKNLDEKLN